MSFDVVGDVKIHIINQCSGDFYASTSSQARRGPLWNIGNLSKKDRVEGKPGLTEGLGGILAPAAATEAATNIAVTGTSIEICVADE